ncbi:MAG: hypothetical protein AAGA99_17875 [Actinomycetota bacterium]
MAGASGPDPRCELCAADRFTHWYHEDEVCWVADCEACDTPMVVWAHHGTEPDDEQIEHMLRCLAAAADERFGAGDWSFDRTMRQVPEHFHAHARDPGWWGRRLRAVPSRYTGVGGERCVGRPPA